MVLPGWPVRVGPSGLARMGLVRTATAKNVQTYSSTGDVIAREYYNLTADPAENLNLLGDSSTANDPPSTTITAMTNQLNAFRTCTGTGCVG